MSGSNDSSNNATYGFVFVTGGFVVNVRSCVNILQVKFFEQNRVF